MAQPAEARFKSEDPIGIRFTPNLYEYVRNNPIHAIDPSGLALVATGVEMCKGYERMGVLVETIMPVHYFITIDGKGYGLFEVNDNAIGTAKVRDNDLTVYPIDSCRSACARLCADSVMPATCYSFCIVRRGCDFPPKTPYYSVCDDHVLDDVCFDIATFKECVRERIADYTKNPGTYVVLYWDCLRFAGQILIACESKARAKKKRSLSCWQDLLCTLTYGGPPKSHFDFPPIGISEGQSL